MSSVQIAAPIPGTSSTTGYFTPALLLLFVGSGCSALIYEIVWFHILQLVIGASAISLAVLLGSFMGGMCLGSVAFPRYVSSKFHPLRVYACLELGIGLMGALLYFLLPFVGRIYLGSFGYGLGNILIRGLVAALCLLPPTVLMGATLPAVARWIRTTKVGVSRLGFFYGANIAGAVLGTLLTGFYLLRVHDTVFATYVAVAINVAVGIIALRVAAKHKFKAEYEALEEGGRVPLSSNAAYLVVALSGLTALGAEVVWTRQFSLLFGATVYNFSLILAVFLTGLGIGSGVGSLVARRSSNAAQALAQCQMLLVPAILWGALMITQRVPYWQPSEDFLPWLYERSLDSMAYVYAFDMFRCAVAMLPATLLWGASFPLALGVAAEGRRESGKLVGGVYAANTVGAIIGSLFVTLVWIPYAGTQSAQQAFMVLGVCAAEGPELGG